jgi:Protein of unknown function (DUF2949)
MPTHDCVEVTHFLRQNLNLSDDSVELALKQSQSDYHNLPIILWQYGLISLVELDKIYDWFESSAY